MAKYIAIRSYRLKPGVDRSAFEQAFAHVEDPDASVGFERAILLQGYQSAYPEVAGSDIDYVSLHVYDSPAGCQRAVQALREGHVPAMLRAFVEQVGAARRGEIAETAVAGYTLVHGVL